MPRSASTTTGSLLTAEEFALQQEPANGARQELVEGRIVTMPSPQGDHGYLLNVLNGIIGNYVESKKFGWVLSDSGIITLRNPDSVRAPDLAFYSNNRFSTYPRGYATEVPDLVVEITSPTDRHSEVEKKIWEYLKCGVPVVWSVDPSNQTVTIFKGLDRAQHLELHDVIKGIEQLPGFECPVSRLFDLGAR